MRLQLHNFSVRPLELAIRPADAMPEAILVDRGQQWEPQRLRRRRPPLIDGRLVSQWRDEKRSDVLPHNAHAIALRQLEVLQAMDRDFPGHGRIMPRTRRLDRK